MDYKHGKQPTGAAQLRTCLALQQQHISHGHDGNETVVQLACLDQSIEPVTAREVEKVQYHITSEIYLQDVQLNSLTKDRGEAARGRGDPHGVLLVVSEWAGRRVAEWQIPDGLLSMKLSVSHLCLEGTLHSKCSVCAPVRKGCLRLDSTRYEGPNQVQQLGQARGSGNVVCRKRAAAQPGQERQGTHRFDRPDAAGMTGIPYLDPAIITSTCKQRACRIPCERVYGALMPQELCCLFQSADQCWISPSSMEE